jgi:hypothetical protein
MINEASPNNFVGSVSPEQLRSRVWISDCLKHIDRPINNCIVLGSWYGILPYVLKKYNKIPKIIANDIDKHCIEISKKLNPTIKHIHGDCNQLHYKKPIDCVINPSVNNIVDRGWFERIPKGTLCLLQTENIETEKGCPSNLNEMLTIYPLNSIMAKKQLNCKDTNEKFIRSLVIGIK